MNLSPHMLGEKSAVGRLTTGLAFWAGEHADTLKGMLVGTRTGAQVMTWLPQVLRGEFDIRR